MLTITLITIVLSNYSLLSAKYNGMLMYLMATIDAKLPVELSKAIGIPYLYFIIVSFSAGI